MDDEGEMPGTMAQKGLDVLDGAKFMEEVKAKNCFPTTKFADYLKKQNGAGFGMLDFRGIDQVTDEVLLVLHDVADVLPNVTETHLEGCVHITDLGVTHLAMACPKLEKVFLDGCPNLTELTLSVLHQHCGHLKFASMIATSVTYINPDLNNLELRLNGCPLVNPMLERHNLMSYSWPMAVEKKLVIMGKDSTNFSIIEFLCSGKVNKVDPDYMEYRPMVTIPGVKNVFNAFECHTKVALLSPFIKQKGLYVLAADLDNPEIESFSLYITGRMNAIRGQTPTAPVIILCHHDNTKAPEKRKQASEITKNLREYLTMQNEAVNQAAQFDSYKSSFAVERGFACQQRWMRCVPFLTRQNNDGFCLARVNTDTKQVELHWPEMDVIHQDLNRRLQVLEKSKTDLLWNFNKKYLAKVSKVKELDPKDLSALTIYYGLEHEYMAIMMQFRFGVEGKKVEGMTDPPSVLVKLGGPLKALFRLQSGNWPDLQKFLTATSCINEFANFKLAEVPKDVLTDLQQYIDDEELNSSKLEQVSVAAFIIWQWIQAVYVFGIYYSVRLAEIKQEIEDITKWLHPEAESTAADKDSLNSTENMYQDQDDLVAEMKNAEEFYQGTLEPAYRNLQSLSKSDITELRSFQKPPQKVGEVMSCVLILFDIKVRSDSDTWKHAKKVMSDSAFLRKLLEYDKESVTSAQMKKLKPYIENPEMNADSLNKISKAVSAFWGWVVSVYRYAEIYQRIVILKKTAQLTQTKLASGTSKLTAQDHGVLQFAVRYMNWLGMIDVALRVGDKNYESPDMYMSPDFQQFTCQVVDKKTDRVWHSQGSSLAQQAMLCKLHDMGKLLFFPDVPCKPVVVDPQWFMQLLSSLQQGKRHSHLHNNHRVRMMSPTTPLFSLDDIMEVCKDYATQEQTETVIPMLRCSGILIDLPGSCFQLAANENEDKNAKMFMFSHLHDKAYTMTGLDSGKHSSFHVREKYWCDIGMENFNSTDVQVHYSYKFTTGIPAGLWPQVLAEALKVTTVLRVWRWGIILSMGAAEVQIKHNVHMAMMSSSLDVQGRVTRFGPETSLHIVQQYLWSVVNNFILIIDFYAHQYKNLYVKVRQPCQANCSQSGFPHTYSLTELKREADLMLACKKCLNKGMSKEEVGFLTGWRAFLPHHDFRPDVPGLAVNVTGPYFNWTKVTDGNPETTRHCKHCGISKDLAMRQWRMQYPVSPAFSQYCLALPEDTKEDWTPQRGSLLVGPSGNQVEAENSVTVMCRGRLYMWGITDVQITVLEPGPCKIILTNQLQSQTDNEQEGEGAQLEPKLVLDLQAGTLGRLDVENGMNEVKDSKYCFHAGDSLIVTVLREKLVEINGSQNLHLEVLFMKNGAELVTLDMPYEDTYMGVCFERNTDIKQPVQLVFRCPSFPMVTGDHFPLNSALLFKSDVGTQWMVGYVLAASDGNLTVSPTTSDQQLTKEFTPDSLNILPINSFNDGLSVVIGRDLVRTKEQLIKHLLSLNLWPAPVALFTGHIEKGAWFSYFDMRRYNPKMCTINVNSPQVLKQSMILSNAWKSSGESRHLQAVPLILLPSGLYTEQLLHPNRQLAHKWNTLAAHPMCAGNTIPRPEQGQQDLSGDVHLLNLPELPLAEDNACIMLITQHKQLLHVASQFKRQQPLPQSWQRSFPQVDPDFPAEEVLQGLQAWMEINQSTYILWHVLEEYLQASQPKRLSRLNKTPFKQKIFSLFEDVKSVLTTTKTKHLCCATHNTIALMSDFFSSNHVGEFASCVTHVEIVKRRVNDIPADLFCVYLKQLVNLEALQITGCSVDSLKGILVCKNLKVLSVPNTGLREIHSDLAELKSLTHLNFAMNPIAALPDFVTDMSCLVSLDISRTLILTLSEDIGNLLELRRLLMKSTLVSQLPKSFAKLKNLETLEISGISWVSLSDRNKELFTEKRWMTWCKDHVDLVMDNKTQKDMFEKHDIIKDGSLNAEETESLNKDLFKRYPRFCCDSDDPYGGIPPEIFACRNLRTLSIMYHGLRFVPDDIGNLRRLEHVSFENNPELEVISSKIGKANIKSFGVKGCPMLKTPPKEIVSQGMKNVIAFLKRLAQGSITCYRTKLMFVGLGGAGKTSLMRALMSSNFRAPVTEGEGITDGIDISLWTLNRSGKALTYSVWDFAGQSVYYNTHQFFLSHRAVYMLVWNTRLGYEHSGLDFWLSSIACHCPQAPVFVIGTHADKISKSDLPKEKLKTRFPNISGFATISSYTGLGVSDLLEAVVKETLAQPYLGEQIPKAWLSFERAVLGMRTKMSLLSWKELSKMAQNSGIYSNEIRQAVHFLHELGTLQHFDNELLQDRVIINPQWIVDVMACVVTVHNKVIIDGHLRHTDIGKIWKDYPASLHDWMLKLTEVFDLTFPLPDKPENIVPCLLPQTEPQYTWPSVDDQEDWQASIFIYKFDYLPAGLFNRAQVRLYQFSDSSKMWKTGSVLSKNGHMAKLTQTGETSVSVQVIGPRPENVQLLIHEVFEGLISEFFQGVRYEYQMPCADCMKVRVKEPTMFSSHVLRRAIELKALFLQCHTLFHTLSIQDVQTSLPPQSNTDYDLQLQHTIRDLKSLEDDLGSDVFFMYCEDDIPNNETLGQVVNPYDIKQSLEDMDFKCWFSSSLASRKVEDLAVAIKNSKIVLVLISDKFVDSPHCQRMFHFMKDTLHKDFLLLMVGMGRSWQESEIGMMVTEKVFINFQRLSHYDEKMQELTNKLNTKVGKHQNEALADPDVFISYAWVNSASAVARGQAKAREGSLGYGDPRELKKFIEKELNLSCWMDVERTGKMGLFEDIADGMKKSKVVVACISDEYVMSSNCQMEFRFAHVALRRPIILVLVGTGLQWESTEIGMLSLGYPRVNFLVANNNAHKKLVTLVKEHLQKSASSDTVVRPLSSNIGGQKQQAFQELYELAQRKFLRQIVGYIEQNDHYPRLFVADLNYDPTSKENDQQGTADLAEVHFNTEEDGNGARFVFDDLLAGQFCIKVLCEHEGGWHNVGDGFPVELSGSDLVALWQLSAPYMGRILAILKHSNINLHIVNTDEGEKLVRALEDRVGVEGQSEVRPYYMALRSYVISKDRQNKKGGLTRCYMPSGKILWLCEEHSQLPRVTKLPDSEFSIADGSEETEGRSAEIQLLNDLRDIGLTTDKSLDSPDISKTIALETSSPLAQQDQDTNTQDKSPTPTFPVDDGSVNHSKMTPSAASSRQSSRQSKKPSKHLSSEEKLKVAGSLMANGVVGDSGQNSRACIIL